MESIPKRIRNERQLNRQLELNGAARGDKYIQIAIPNKVDNKKMKIKSIISKSQGANIINSFETHDISLKNTVYTSDERLYTLYHYEPIAGLFTNDDTIIVEYDEVR